MQHLCGGVTPAAAKAQRAQRIAEPLTRDVRHELADLFIRIQTAIDKYGLKPSSRDGTLDIQQQMMAANLELALQDFIDLGLQLPPEARGEDAAGDIDEDADEWMERHDDDDTFRVEDADDADGEDPPEQMQT